MDALIVKEITKVKNVQLGRLLVLLCEGTTHYPAQCHIYPKVQEITKQQKEAVKETLRESLRKPVMKEDVDDPDGESLNRFYSNAC